MTDGTMRALSRLAAAVVVAVAIGVPAGAAVAGPREEAVRDWVAAVGDLPRWSARAAGIAEADDGALVERLIVGSSAAGVLMRFEELRFAGRVEATGATLAAGSIEAERATFTVQGVTYELRDISLQGARLPDFGDLALRDRGPVRTALEAYRVLAKFETREGSVTALDVVEEEAGVASRIGYQGIRFRDWRDGVVGEIDIGGMRMASPERRPVVQASVDRFRGEEIDLRAIVAAYDPAAHEEAGGEPAWQVAFGGFSYDRMMFAVPDMTVRIGEVSGRDIAVRQAEESFVDVLDAALGGRRPDLAGAVNAFQSTIKVGELTVNDIEVTTAGIDELRLASFSLRDASVDFLGELAIDGFASAVLGEGFLDLGRLAIGDVVPLPDARPGGDGPPLLRVGRLEVADLDLQSLSVPRTQLGRLEARMDDYVGLVPRTVSLDMEGLMIATELVFHDEARRMLGELGYDAVDADLGVTLRWQPGDGSVALDRFDFAMREFGTVSAQARLDGLDRNDTGDVARLSAAVVDELKLADGNLTFRDDSLVERGLAMQARQLNVEPEVFREQMASALPFMLSFVGTPEFQRKIVPVLQAFIRTPNELAITAAPGEPVAIGRLRDAVRSAPQTVPTMLGVTLEGTPPADAPEAEEAGETEAPEGAE